MVAQVLLLEGPDGYRYRATQVPGRIWYLESFMHGWKESEWWWWKERYSHNGRSITYSMDEVNG